MSVFTAHYRGKCAGCGDGIEPGEARATAGVPGLLHGDRVERRVRMRGGLMTTDWKNAHANAASKSIMHELVEGVIEEFMSNIGLADDGLPAYGIRKVALYAAQVARADALGFDPNLLRMSPDEATSHQLDLAARAVLNGIPVHMLDTGEDS